LPSLLCIGRRLKGTGVTTYSLHPGVIATQLGNDVTTNLGPVFGTVFSLAKLLFKSPDEGIQTTLYCCLDDCLAGERIF
jgi:retinol dehydrogenase-12